MIQAIQSAEWFFNLISHLLSEIQFARQSIQRKILRGIFHSWGFWFDDFQSSCHHSAEGSPRNIAESEKLTFGKTDANPALISVGQADELLCGRWRTEFIKKMIRESADFRSQVLWFYLWAKSEHLKLLQVELKKGWLCVWTKSPFEMATGK